MITDERTFCQNGKMYNSIEYHKYFIVRRSTTIPLMFYLFVFVALSEELMVAFIKDLRWKKANRWIFDITIVFLNSPSRVIHRDEKY